MDLGVVVLGVVFIWTWDSVVELEVYRYLRCIYILSGHDYIRLTHSL